MHYRYLPDVGTEVARRLQRHRGTSCDIMQHVSQQISNKIPERFADLSDLDQRSVGDPYAVLDHVVKQLSSALTSCIT